MAEIEKRDCEDTGLAVVLASALAGGVPIREMGKVARDFGLFDSTVTHARTRALEQGLVMNSADYTSIELTEAGEQLLGENPPQNFEPVLLYMAEIAAAKTVVPAFSMVETIHLPDPVGSMQLGLIGPRPNLLSA